MIFLQAKKALIKKLSEYLNYINIFLVNFIMELLKYNNINDYIIKLIKSKKLLKS